MKSAPIFLLCTFSAVLNVSSITAYVDRNGTNPISPYASWSTAATNIQDALNYIVGGPVIFSNSIVIVTNGIYDTGSTTSPGGPSRVAATQPVTIQSVNGPSVTIIKGAQMPGTTNGANAVRGVYLIGGAVLSGFTITNGATPAGQVGGGILCQATNALVTNCIITGNCSANGAGGVFSGTLVNCIVAGNITFGFLGGGAYNSLLTNCIIFGNQAWEGSVGQNCRFDNCTIVSNTAGLSAINDCYSRNCIIYYNYRTNGTPLSGGTTATNCCIFPPISSGANNFTNPPLFQNLAGGDFHLQPLSPCIDAGNSAFVSATTDLDGNPRVRGVSVDVGAYESAPVHFVNLGNSAPSPPFISWATAATNIQDAIDVAIDGDIVLVSNGVYQVGARAIYGVESNRVVIDKALTVQSVNGNSVTIILGVNPYPGGNAGVRCVYMTNGALLNGFLLANGATRSSGDVTNEQSGGGVWCESSSAVISNCVILNNYANQNGGAVFRGTLYNCTLATNVAFIAGGGAYSATLNDCTINSNKVIQGTGGGGVWGSAANNCLVISNFAASGGGAYGGVLSNCVVTANRASGAGGGGYSTVFIGSTVQSNTAGNSGGGIQFGRVQNCIVKGNFGPTGGGLYSTVGANSLIISNSATSGGGAYNPILTNCTMVANSASSAGGGVYAVSGSLQNCIIYYNTGADLFGAKINYCCCPGAKGDIFSITNPPLFVDFAHGDFRLQTNSPCINSGANILAPVGVDLDNNSRIVNYTVDIGAYESQTAGSVISYAFLQQYGFPTDGSADYLDSDGDGMSNWQEWRCFTNPTNATSRLTMLTPQNGGSSPQVRWTSVGSVTYYLQRATDLTAPQPFTTIRSNIFGGGGTTLYSDTTATGPGPYFYRVGVQ